MAGGSARCKGETVSCQAPECPSPAIWSWERAATAAELAEWIGSGDLPPGSTEARVTVLACGDHTVDGQRRTGLHESDCSAPPATDGACDCTPTYPEPDAQV